MESINVIFKDISTDNQKRLEILNDQDELIQSKDGNEVSDEINDEVETKSDKDEQEVQ
jgi:hypothetical protein